MVAYGVSTSLGPWALAVPHALGSARLGSLLSALGSQLGSARLCSTLGSAHDSLLDYLLCSAPLCSARLSALLTRLCSARLGSTLSSLLDSQLSARLSALCSTLSSATRLCSARLSALLSARLDSRLPALRPSRLSPLLGSPLLSTLSSAPSRCSTPARQRQRSSNPGRLPDVSDPPTGRPAVRRRRLCDDRWPGSPHLPGRPASSAALVTTQVWQTCEPAGAQEMCWMICVNF